MASTKGNNAAGKKMIEETKPQDEPSNGRSNPTQEDYIDPELTHIERLWADILQHAESRFGNPIPPALKKELEARFEEQLPRLMRTPDHPPYQLVNWFIIIIIIGILHVKISIDEGIV